MAVVALPQPPPIVVAYMPPHATNIVAPTPLEVIIQPDVDNCCFVSGSLGRGNNGGGANCDELFLVNG